MPKGRTVEDQDADYLALVEALTNEFLPRQAAHMAVATLLQNPALARVVNDRKQ